MGEQGKRLWTIFQGGQSIGKVWAESGLLALAMARQGNWWQLWGKVDEGKAFQAYPYEKEHDAHNHEEEQQ